MSSGSSQEHPSEMAMDALRKWRTALQVGTPTSPSELPSGLMRGSSQVTSCMLVACLASCAAGTTLGYASTAVASIEREPWYTLERQPPENRLFANLLLLVAAPGSLVSGLLLEVVGNRTTLLLSAFGLLGSWLTLLFCANTFSLFLARVMAGVFLGALSSCVGLHVADICPSRCRAFFVGLVEVTRSAGVLLSYMLGYWCSWEVHAGLCVLPPLLLMCLQNRVLDSPQWLMRQGRKREASAALQRLYGADVPTEFVLQIRNTWDNVPAWRSARRLALGLLVQLVPCLSCAQLILLRAVQVTEALVADKKAAHLAALWLVSGHVVITAAFASVTWLAGRRHLLLISALMVAACITVLRPLDYLEFSTWSREAAPEETNWTGLRAVGLLLTSYSLGLGHVPALLVAEMLPSNVRSVGAAGAWTARWLLAFVLIHLDTWALAVARYGDSVLFCVVLVSAAVAVFALVPETEGCSLASIQKN